MAPRKKYGTEETSMELQMAPMIDVIFQLIIFFMCSIHFKSLEGKLYSYLPKEKGMGVTTMTDVTILPDVRIRLIYSEDAKPLMSKIRVGDQYFNWNTLATYIENLAPTLILPNGIDIIPVKIDADDRVTTQAVVNALNICKKAGVPKTEFAAKTSPHGTRRQ